MDRINQKYQNMFELLETNWKDCRPPQAGTYDKWEGTMTEFEPVSQRICS